GASCSAAPITNAGATSAVSVTKRTLAVIDLAALAKRAGGDFNGHDALIPGPAHTARDRSLSISIGESGKLIWHSFAGDDAKVILPYLKSLGLDAAFSRGSTQAPRAMSSTTTAKAKFAADLARDIWAA